MEEGLLFSGSLIIKLYIIAMSCLFKLLDKKNSTLIFKLITSDNPSCAHLF